MKSRFIEQILIEARGSLRLEEDPPARAQSRPKKKPGGGEHAGEKGRGGTEEIRVSVWHGKQRMPAARARGSRTG